jgi:hypothetical protein
VIDAFKTISYIKINIAWNAPRSHQIFQKDSVVNALFIKMIGQSKKS